MTGILDDVIEQGAPMENEGYQLKNEATDYGSVKITRKNEVEYGVVPVNGDYVCRSNDRYIISGAGAASTIYLPQQVNSGKVITVKNFSSGTDRDWET